MLLAPLLLLLSGPNLALEASEAASAVEPTPAEYSRARLSGGFVSLQKGRMTLVTDAGVEQIYGELGDHAMAWRGHLELGALSEAELRWSGRGSLRAFGPASIEWSGSPFTGKPLGLFDFVRVELEVRTGELGVRLPGGVLLVAQRSAFEIVQRSSGSFGVHHLAGARARLIVPAEGAPEVRELISGEWLWIDPSEYLFQSRFEYSLEPEPEPAPVAVEPEPIVVLVIDPFVIEPEVFEPVADAAPSVAAEAALEDEPAPEPILDPIVEVIEAPAVVPVVAEEPIGIESAVPQTTPGWIPMVEFRPVAPLLQLIVPLEHASHVEDLPATPPQPLGPLPYRWKPKQWQEPRPLTGQAPAPNKREESVEPKLRGGLRDLLNGLKPPF